MSILKFGKDVVIKQVSQSIILLRNEYLGPAEKVRIIQFKGCYWSGKSFKKQAIVNGESKVRLSPRENTKN